LATNPDAAGHSADPADTPTRGNGADARSGETPGGRGDPRRGDTPRVERPRRAASSDAFLSRPRVGDQLGPFRLLEILGEGGSGVVYRAEHRYLGRPVAIKVLLPELTRRPEMVRRFFQEALAVNKARHPNIIDVTDVVAGKQAPPYIVMELLQGIDLASYINRKAPASPAAMMGIVTQILDALGAVHALGIVHRDLKPENVFLVPDGDGWRVKLLDFGIAKFLHDEDSRRRTGSGNVLGTPAYMPLEQLHGLQVDHRADIYALGVVIYELLSGRLPFETSPSEQAGGPDLLIEPKPPSARAARELREPIPAALDAVVMRCLEDLPAHRFQTVADLRHALEAAVASPARPAEALPAARVAAPSPTPAGALLDEAEPVSALAPLRAVTAPAAPAPAPHPASAPAPAATPTLRRGVLVAVLAAVVLAAAGLAVKLWPTPEAPAPASPPRVGTAPPVGVDAGPQVTPLPRVVVASDPGGAAVVDALTGAPLGTTPCEVEVPTGRTRTVRLRRAGHAEVTATIAPGGPATTVQLPAVEAPPPPERTAARPPAPRGRPRPGGPEARPAERPAARVTDQGILDPFK
jgi:serine/threonine-protein kinase